MPRQPSSELSVDVYFDCSTGVLHSVPRTSARISRMPSHEKARYSEQTRLRVQCTVHNFSNVQAFMPKQVDQDAGSTVPLRVPMLSLPSA